MKKLFLGIAAFVVVATLYACGGGGGGGGGATGTTGFQQTYTVSAAQGELISYSLDTANLTYSYTVIKSQYGCEVAAAACHAGAGTLTKNLDKSYSLSGSASSKIYALESGLLVGSIKLGSMPETPIIGIPNPISTGAGMAGTYNFVSVQCPQKSQGAMTNCLGMYGSLKVTSTGSNTVNYATCESDDIDKNAPSCTSSTTGTGVYDATLNAWKFSRAGSSNENYLVAFTASNGQKVAYLDFNDQGGYGFGQATISEKVALNSSGFAEAAGEWFLVNLAPGSNATSGIVTANADGTVSSGGSMVINTPWDGFVKNTQDTGGMWILAGSGVFTYGGWTDLSGRAKYIVGMKMSP